MKLLWAFFLAGLAGGFSHCIGMCGGVIAACSFAGCAGKARAVGAPVYQSLYHAGRLITYGLLGALFGALGSLPGLMASMRPFQRWVPVVAGVLMVVAGLAVGFNWTGTMKMANAVSKSGRFNGRFNGRFSRAFSKRFNRVAATLSRRGIMAAFPLGLLMGLLPCGMLAVIELRAIAGGSAFWGALLMVAFGLGTIPGLAGFGLASGMIGSQTRGAFLKAGAAIVIVMGILTVVGGISRLSV
ncbi:MAG: sulfite exporter TauE/SafE family protein [Candidatus Aquicultor sp.]